MIQIGQDQVKMEAQQQQYSLQLPSNGDFKVKLELDRTLYPPVKWYPFLQNLNQRPLFATLYEQMPQNDILYLKDFIIAAKTALLQVLNQKQIVFFIKNYDNYATCKFYIFIVLIFAKKKASIAPNNFDLIFNKQLLKLPASTNISQMEQIHRAYNSRNFFLQGELELAVQELYRGQSIQKINQIKDYLIVLDKRISQQIPLIPLFQETNQPIPHPKIQQIDPRNIIQKNYEEMMQNKEGQSQNAKSRSRRSQRVVDNEKDNEQPFIIVSQDDPNMKHLFPYDNTIKFRKRFSDVLEP